jgi:leucyl aminopeptidase
MNAEIYLTSNSKGFVTAKLPSSIAAFWSQSSEESLHLYNGPKGCLMGVIHSGKGNITEHEKLRKEGNKCFLNLPKGITSVEINNVDWDASKALAFVEGFLLSDYRFDKYLTKKSANAPLQVTMSGKGKEKLHEVQVVCNAVNTARNWVNEPVNALNAQGLADAFTDLGLDAGFKVEVFGEAQIESLKMGGLLAVNRGSQEPPTFSVLEYKPKEAKNAQPIVLVGKGVVFDTGGLSLKPTPNSMDMMKCDMAGGAAVGCAIYAIAKAGINVHVIGLIPATDNRPGFNAFAPGDIIKMMDGSSVEMLNSDAEGRMILADALHYAKRYQPQLVIDIATLTGSAAAAIGTFGIVGMGTASQEQKEILNTSGLNVHERIADFPFWDEYDELLKSDIADQKNLGGPYAGAITAGKFLNKFTDYPYYHLDIAGPAFLTAKEHYKPKGGTGVGVRLLFEFLKSI